MDKRNMAWYKIYSSIRRKVQHVIDPVPYFPIPLFIQNHRYLASEKYSISNGTFFTQKV